MFTLSCGIPFGLMIALVGAILFFATRHKVVSLLVAGIGVGITILTIILILLAVNSQM
jgi:hypothetical protein